MAKPATSAGPRRILSIEGLRGVLALWVLLSHALGAAGLGRHWRGPFAVIATGGYAVDVFIIISGFVIFYLLDTAHESYGRFIWRRFLRLYPAYLVCLLISALSLPLRVTQITQEPWPTDLHISNIQILLDSQAWFPEQLLAHLTMVHGFLPDRLLPHSNYAILGQAWSLSLEWQFYVLAPLLFWALSRRTGALIVLALACAAHFLVAGNEGSLPRHIPMFGLGIASYFAWRHHDAPTWPLLMPIGVALAYLLTHAPAVVIWAVIFLAAFQPASFGARAVLQVFESRLLLALGQLSYSIYLTHTIVLALIALALQRADVPSLGQWPYFLLLLALTLLGTLAASYTLRRFVELPFMSRGRRNRAAVAAPSAV